MSRRTLITLVLVAAAGLLAGCGGEGGLVAPTEQPKTYRTITLMTGSPYLANPAVSPDGEDVLFESDVDGDMEIFHAPLGSSIPQALTVNDDFDSVPDWSPDGTRVVFESDRSGRKHIYVLEVAAPQAATALTAGDWDDGSPAWSPAGDLIVFESDRGKALGTDLFVVAVEGGEVRQVTDTPSGVYCRSADWAPDGSALVYESNVSGFSALYVVPAAGGKGARITPDQGYEGHPAWSPDGRLIAFESRISGTAQIHAVAPEGGPVEQLTTGGGLWPSWTPDSAGIVHAVPVGEGYDLLLLLLE